MFVYKDVGEHCLKRRAFILIQDFGQKYDAVVELCIIELSVVVLMTIFFTASLFERSIEDFDAVFVRYHATLN